MNGNNDIPIINILLCINKTISAAMEDGKQDLTSTQTCNYFVCHLLSAHFCAPDVAAFGAIFLWIKIMSMALILAKKLLLNTAQDSWKNLEHQDGKAENLLSGNSELKISPSGIGCPAVDERPSQGAGTDAPPCGGQEGRVSASTSPTTPQENPDTGPAVPLSGDNQAPASLLDHSTPENIIAILGKSFNAGQKIIGYDVVRLLDPEQDNRLVRDWLTTHGIMAKVHFDNALHKHARDTKTHERLGFIPNTARDLVSEYAKLNKISISYKGVVHRDRSIQFYDVNINEENHKICEETEKIFNIATSRNDNIDTYNRDLRIIRDELKLNFNDRSIDDAIADWADKQRELQLSEIYLKISHTKGLATGGFNDGRWKQLEEAAFDISDTEPGFSIAVLKKFFWQVKRKMIGLPVTDHLMPVLTGAQGKGKSTFVRNMLEPLQDCTANTDFQQITDDRNVQLWDFYVLFLDEMGYASKAEIDEVKNIITIDMLTRRPMRTNHSISIKQCATFIGCSNKRLNQLIRDETGLRRFSELVYRKDPDWAAINTLDWRLLWQSVDEKGEDPTKDIKHLLAQQQAENRAVSNVEMWARGMQDKTYDNWIGATPVHERFRDWEQSAFPNTRTDLTAFGREMQRLIKETPDFPWQSKRISQGCQYRRSSLFD